MSKAKLIDSVAIMSTGQIIGLWQYQEGVSSGSESTALIEIELVGFSNDLQSYIHYPNSGTRGKTHIFNMENIAVACLSDNFDIRFFNRYDSDPMNLIGTIYEFLAYTGVDRSTVDSTFDKFTIRNRDNPLTNKIYFYINNPSAINTGVINLEIVYGYYQ